VFIARAGFEHAIPVFEQAKAVVIVWKSCARSVFCMLGITALTTLRLAVLAITPLHNTFVVTISHQTKYHDIVILTQHVPGSRLALCLACLLLVLTRCARCLIGSKDINNRHDSMADEVTVNPLQTSQAKAKRKF
jgi:hypothetical protein